MRTAYLGTSAFAATVLRRLAASEHRPELVVTPPDAPSGRGRKLRPPPVAEAARELELPLEQAADVNDPAAFERLREARPQIVAVCAFGQLIRAPLLAELELLNVHPSLLPRWRGAAPIERAILAGDPVTGVTIMRVSEGLDSGPVALAEPAEIERRYFGDLAGELAALGGELLVRALDLSAAGELELTEQDDGRATYAEKIEPAERRLDPLEPAQALERRVRALTPHVGAYLALVGGERLGVRAAAAASGSLPSGAATAEEGGESIALGCREGVLRLTEVQPQGGRVMSVSDYLRGHGLPRIETVSP